MDYADIIPWTISVISLLFVILTFVRNGTKDKKNEIKEENQMMNSIRENLLKVNLKLDQVCVTTNETRSDIKLMNTKIQNLDKEIEVIKRDLKTAFIRIDEIKERVM